LRIADSLRADALWKLSPGDAAVMPQPELRWVTSAIDPRLAPSKRFRVDEPRVNPLVEPLTFSVLSASFRPESGVATWPGTWEFRRGRGDVRLRWLGQRFARDQVEELGPVDDLLLLSGSDALRFRIDLTVLPPPRRALAMAQRIPFAGPALTAWLCAWSPPAVDSLRIRSEAPPAGAEER
jgi:hypothetical protein